MKLWRFLFAIIFLAGVPGCRSGGSAGASSGEVSQVSLSRPPPGTLQVAFIDVGQGDGALVQSPDGTALLIDGGPPGAGPQVMDSLRQAGVDKVDWMLGTHPHSDHIDGLVDVLRGMPVEQALDPGYNHGTALQRTYLSLLKSKKVKTTRARAGQSYDLGGGALLEILAPQDPLLSGTNSDANNNSIVARVVFGSTRFLFTGDMEQEERARLLKSTDDRKLRAEVLKVAHHGSHNGTDPEFLETVQPKYAVISLAKHNDYGHPHKEALEALKDAGVEILRTDQLGTIVFTSDGKQVTLRGTTSGGSAAATPAAPERRTRVIGNRTSHIYHAPDCGSLPAKSKRTEFDSVGEAERAGYRPHKACMR